MKADTFIKSICKLLGKKGLTLFFLAILSALGIAVVELLVSYLLQLLFFNFGFSGRGPNWMSRFQISPSISFIGFGLLFIAVLRFIVQFTTTHVAIFLNDYVAERLRKSLINSVIFDDSFEKTPSYINYHISEIHSKCAEFITQFSNLTFMLVQTSFLFCILFFIAWKEAILATIGILIIGTIILTINKKISLFAAKIPKIHHNIHEMIAKITRNFLFIKLMNIGLKEYEKTRFYIHRAASASVRANILSTAAVQTGPFLGILLLVIIILAGRNLWHTEGVILISFVYLLSRFIQSLSILSAYFGTAVILFPRFQLALPIINHPSFTPIVNQGDSVSFFGKMPGNDEENLYLTSTTSPLAKPAAVFSCQEEILPLQAPAICFREVSFSHPSASPLFSHINLEIPPGSQTGIIGPSGSGKSTLLLLLTGMLHPSTGSVLIAGLEPRQYISSEGVRIGYVGPEPFLMKGSLRENLCFGLATVVNETHLQHVLKQVGLEDLSPDTLIGEDHSGLSAGQKQRVCLARALLNQPTLLILDEATANLDNENESLVAEILKDIKHSCTTLIVSHRPGILIHADRIINIRDITASS